VDLAAREDRPFRVGADDLDVRVALLQVAAHPGDRAARPHAGDEHVDAAARLLPELGPRGHVVRLRVRLVVVLVGLERPRDVLAQAVRGAVVAAGILGLDGRRADHDLGAEGAQEVDLLLAHLVGHDEHASVAAVDRRHDEPDAGVAARGLDDRAAWPQAAVTLGGLDHRQPDAILHAPTGVQRLHLGEQGRGHAGREALQAHERRTPHEVDEGVDDVHEASERAPAAGRAGTGSSLAKPRGAHRRSACTEVIGGRAHALVMRPADRPGQRALPAPAGRPGGQIEARSLASTRSVTGRTSSGRRGVGCTTG
jgi:hypothetical protein